MVDHRILVLADDLTGALEVGAKFAAAGVRSVVTTADDELPLRFNGKFDAVVLDAETRHLDASKAAGRVRDLAKSARHEGYSIVFKKTDSTLRGNIGAELAALVEAYPHSPLLYVPAYPQMGRTVKQGVLLIEGTPVGESDFARDALNPVTESHIPTLLATQCVLPIHSGSANELRDVQPGTIAICDGETEADLDAAAKAFVSSPSFRLAAGPSGLVTHLARQFKAEPPETSPLPRGQSVLVVNGSLHPVSVQQVEQAQRDGFAVVESTEISRGRFEDAWTILKVVSSASPTSIEFGQQLAKFVRQALLRAPIDTLIVFGGDTAFAIVEELGRPLLHPLGEVMEGIPISEIESNDLRRVIDGRGSDLRILTKAGGFGPANVLASIRSVMGERQGK